MMLAVPHNISSGISSCERMEMGSSYHTDIKPGITNVEKHEVLQNDPLHEFTAAEIGALAHL